MRLTSTCLAFLLALPLGYVGVYIRRKLDETPHFKALEEAHHVPQTPVVELLTKHRREVLIAFGGTLLNAVGVRKADGSLVDDFGDPSLKPGQISGMLA